MDVKSNRKTDPPTFHRFMDLPVQRQYDTFKCIEQSRGSIKVVRHLDQLS